VEISNDDISATGRPINFVFDSSLTAHCHQRANQVAYRIVCHGFCHVTLKSGGVDRRRGIILVSAFYWFVLQTNKTVLVP